MYRVNRTSEAQKKKIAASGYKMEKGLVKDSVFVLTQNPFLTTYTNNSWYENANIFCKK